MTTVEPLLDPPYQDDRPDDSLDRKTWTQQVLLTVFLVVPFLAIIAAVPLTWGWGLTLRDVIIATVMYAVTGLGITVGFHRYLTHRSFVARRPVRIALAIAGSMALQSSAIQWVADHRRHHRFSDKEGDPHSPWRYGTSFGALAKGFLYSHVGWLYDWEKTDELKYAPELIADPDINYISRKFSTWVGVSLLLPPLVGGLWGWSWQAAVTAFVWGSLIRIALLHHVTFAINSVCHITGRRPFRTKDRSQNVWWLSILSFGESWHNFHHAEPTSARHGVRFFEIDTSAMLIKTMERLHWVSDVRWPDRSTIARRRVTAEA
ncbi:MAG TPA: acyl-CoA desaturase [Acidimicrobiales bacterium]|jgi:stearoyl-CoA desaturase (delta-9 desaturase)|nr:acyl-CoA desaturase [Acidimicrobiales bacterium]